MVGLHLASPASGPAAMAPPNAYEPVPTSPTSPSAHAHDDVGSVAGSVVGSVVSGAHTGGVGGLHIDVSQWSLRFSAGTAVGRPRGVERAQSAGQSRQRRGRRQDEEAGGGRRAGSIDAAELTARRFQLRTPAQQGRPVELERHYALANAARRVVSTRIAVSVGTLACGMAATHKTAPAYSLAQLLLGAPPLVAVFVLTFFAGPFVRAFEPATGAAIVLFGVSQTALYEAMLGSSPHLLITCVLFFWSACSLIGFRFHVSLLVTLALLVQYLLPSLAAYAARGSAAVADWSCLSLVSCVGSAALACGASYLRDRTERRLFLQELQLVSTEAHFGERVAGRPPSAAARPDSAASSRVAPASPGPGPRRPEPLAARAGSLAGRSHSTALAATRAAAEALALAAAEAADEEGGDEGPAPASPPLAPRSEAGARSGRQQAHPPLVRLTLGRPETPEREGRSPSLAWPDAAPALRVDPAGESCTEETPVTPLSPSRPLRPAAIAFQMPGALLSRSMKRSRSRESRLPEAERRLSGASDGPPDPAPPPAHDDGRPLAGPVLLAPPAAGKGGVRAAGSGLGALADHLALGQPPLGRPPPARPLNVPPAGAAPAGREALWRRAGRWLARGGRLEPPELEAGYQRFYVDVAWRRVRLLAGPLVAAYLASVVLFGMLGGQAGPPQSPRPAETLAESLARTRLDWALELGLTGAVFLAGLAILLARPGRLVPWFPHLCTFAFLVAQFSGLTALKRIMDDPVVAQSTANLRGPPASWLPDFWYKVSHVDQFFFLASTFWLPLRFALASTCLVLLYGAPILLSSAPGDYYLYMINFFVVPAVIGAVACARGELNLRRRFCIEHGLVTAG